MKRIRVFLDSNIYIAGLVSATGASAEILRLAEADVFQIITSKLIFEEVERNFKKKLPEFLPFWYYAIDCLKIHIFKDISQTKPEFTKFFPKSTDQIIFETALKLCPDYFVSLNRKHFHQSKIIAIANFPILTPANFLHACRKREREKGS
jgi:putative PIN family toxin of toxin-antitoxin system